jgi:predicted phage tail protein
VVATLGTFTGEMTKVDFDITWNQVPTATTYEIRYATAAEKAADKYSKITVVDSGQTTSKTKIEWVLPNTTYYFNIRAQTQWGLLDWSNEVVKSTGATAIPTAPNPVTNIAITESLYTTSDTKGSTKSRATITWDAAVGNIRGYDVNIWRPVDTSWVSLGLVSLPKVVIEDTKPGTHQIQVRVIDAFGTPSTYNTKSQALTGMYAPPSNVSGVGVVVTRGQIRLFWNAISDIDVLGYEIQLGTVWSTTNGNPILVTDYAGTSYNWTPTNQTGDINFLIKAKDQTGVYSVTATAYKYTIVGPNPVDILKGNVIDNIVELH